MQAQITARSTSVSRPSCCSQVPCERNQTNSWLCACQHSARLPVHIRKLGKFRDPKQVYCSDGTIPLFCDDDLRDSLLCLGKIPVIIPLPVQKHHHICILFDGAGFPKIRQHGPVIRTLLHRAGYLRQGHDRDIQLPGQSL